MSRHEDDNLQDRAMQEWLAEEDRIIAGIMESTPEKRKKWDLEEWITALFWNRELIYEDDCPIHDFSPEQWKRIITDGCGTEAQYCPCRKKVLAILTRDDFRNYGSYSICQALKFDGEWLAHLFPLKNIVQQDFDDYLVCDPEDYLTEEDFLELVGSLFPRKVIPAHLDYPHKGESLKK